MSATKVITADTYDDDGFPITMGLMDQRLSVIEPGLRCKTCGLKVGKDKCPGHFGHIDLAMPVVHVGFVKTIRNSLRATCRRCGRVLLPEKEAKNSWRQSTKTSRMAATTATSSKASSVRRRSLTPARAAPTPSARSTWINPPPLGRTARSSRLPKSANGSRRSLMRTSSLSTST